MTQKLDIAGLNIIEHMRRRSILKTQQQKYYFWHSRLWEALKKHILDENECKVLIWEPDSFILTRRTMGSAIRLLEAGVYPLLSEGGKILEPSKFWINFEIDWARKKTISGFNINIEEYTKFYSLDIPTDLEINFSIEKFNKWCHQIKANREKEIRDQEIALLKKLREKYPDV